MKPNSLLKQNRGKLLFTSLVTVLPALVGLLLWDRLPDTIATHFNFQGIADGWSSKGFGVFALPALMLATHLFCIFIIAADPKAPNIGAKPIGLLFWIVPVVSLVLSTILYSFALGLSVNASIVCNLLLGVLLIVLGNLMPKVKQNYSFGLKLPWTLHDSENWNRTHRLAGWCMAAAGVVLLVNALWANAFITLGAIIASTLIPIVCSYLDYIRKREK